MKTFEEIYEEIQHLDNTELNEAWSEAKKENEKTKKIGIIICLIIDVPILLFCIRNRLNFAYLPAIIIALATNIIEFGIIKLIFSKGNRKYSSLYKDIVINRLMSNFYDNLEYFPTKEMPEYVYAEANYEYYDLYSSDDYMEGQVNNKNSIQMAEVLTQREETHIDSEGKEEKETITVFHGLFAKVIIHKSIKGELRIVQNGGMAFNKERLKMDSSEFEKYFDVQASDKILGMRLLTADIMEALVDFQNKTNMKYDVYIRDNELYLRFYSGPMFEVGRNLKKGAIDEKTVKKYFYMLNFTYNLSNKFINLIEETEI